MVDVSKNEPRLCYGTDDKRKSLIAVFFRKVARPMGWVKENCGGGGGRKGTSKKSAGRSSGGK